MPKFRKNPIEIEAVRFTGDNHLEMNKFVGKTFPIDGDFHWGFSPVGPFDNGVIAQVWDKLHETWVGVKDGQWIIKGTKGEFYPCDDEVFRETYSEIRLPPILQTEEYHDENTLTKVTEVLDNVGSISLTGEEIVSKLQNAGILFRERK